MTTTWVQLLGAAVKYDGRKYPGRYFEAGAGEPLLLLHGGGGYAENFTRNLMVYARYFHVFALDAAWFGLGPQPPFDEDIMAVWLDQISDFLEWKGFDIDGARDGHLGLGFETALGCVDRSGWGREELGRLRAVRQDGEPRRPGVELLFPEEADPFFRAERIRPRGAAPLPTGLSILVVTGGSGTLEWGDRLLDVGRGDTVLVPFAAGDCVLRGSLEAVRCMPPDPGAPDASVPTFR